MRTIEAGGRYYPKPLSSSKFSMLFKMRYMLFQEKHLAEHHV
jgi:hypothetical protein